MKNNKVTVIIPVYNVEKYLKKCLNSVFSQTYDNYDVIVINDVSTDNSASVIEEFYTKYKEKMIVINNKVNSGISFSRNVGTNKTLELSTSEFIVYIDSDDYIENDYLERLINEAIKNEADIVICGQTQVDEAGNYLRTIDRTPDMIVDARNYAMPGQAWCRAFRLDIIRDYNISFSNGIIFEDVVYTLEINAVAKKIIGIEYNGYYHRVNGKSIFGELRKKGLDDKKIPYDGLEEAVKFCISNGKYEASIIEIFVLRILTTFIFDFARGSKKEVIKHLSSYTYMILKTYFPKYYKNQYVKIRRVKCFSVFQRLAVWAFVKSVRFGLLYPFARLMTLSKKSHR